MDWVEFTDRAARIDWVAFIEFVALIVIAINTMLILARLSGIVVLLRTITYGVDRIVDHNRYG